VGPLGYQHTARKQKNDVKPVPPSTKLPLFPPSAFYAYWRRPRPKRKPNPSSSAGDPHDAGPIGDCDLPHGGPEKPGNATPFHPIEIPGCFTGREGRQETRPRTYLARIRSRLGKKRSAPVPPQKCRQVAKEKTRDYCPLQLRPSAYFPPRFSAAPIPPCRKTELWHYRTGRF